MEKGRPLQNMAEAFKELRNRLNEFPEGEEARSKSLRSLTPALSSLLSSDVSAVLSYTLR